MTLISILLLSCTPDVGIQDTDTTTPDPEDTADTAETVVQEGPIFIHEHDEVATLLVVTWSQEADAELSWIEYRFDDTVMSTPPLARTVGEQRAVLLGIPSDTVVTLEVFDQTKGEKVVGSGTFTGTTGSLPNDLPEPDLEVWDSTLASPEPWVLISLDTAGPHEWYRGPYYVIILNRQGRIVWYHPVPDYRVSMFPAVALDGTHLLFDESTAYFATSSGPRIRRLSLDYNYNEEIETSRYVYGFTELAEGGFLRDYGNNGQYSLVEQSEDGTLTTIWDCDPWLDENLSGDGLCYTNAVNYDPVRNTVLWSLPYHDTVLEIDRGSGEVIRVFGELSPTHETVPSDALFDFQHYPSYTPDSTLLVSMHIEGTTDQQRAREYRVDDETGKLTEIWSYGAAVQEYAYYSGEAWRHENGNTLLNYGTGGAAREITADQQVVWDIGWDTRYLTGHLSLIDDLYPLLSGPQ